MLKFHPLTVADLRPEAADAVCITLEVPDELREAYRFLPGQHVGIRATIDGKDVRRTYSICSASDERHLRIGVRLHDQGDMSRHLGRQLRAGDQLEVLTPTGRFFATIDPSAAHNYVAFAGGSGITPILGIVRNVLMSEPNSRCTLFYGNRTTGTIMFAEELLALKDRYPGRLALNFILSREPQDIDLFNGRLDEEKVRSLAGRLFDPAGADAYFLCGPGNMIESVHDALVALGVEPARIHSEHFVSGVAAQQRGPEPVREAPRTETQMTQVTVVMDGRRRSFAMAPGGPTVLEAAERAGLE